MSLLTIRNLSVTFETASGPFRAVDGVDMTIDPGEVLGIVGESGSGKSVAMLGLMGLLPNTATVTADQISFEGRDMLAMGERERRRIIGREIAMIFQEPIASLNPCFTAGFQIGEALSTHLGLRGKERRDRTIELLRQVGIPEPERRMNAFPHQLSGGMSQRVMIAMAIACEPKLLIADEPTTALDVTIQAQILDLLLDLQRERGMAMVLITHDMGVIAETAERVVVQYAGQQVERQSVAGLFETPRHPYTSALLAAMPERARGGRLPTIPGVVPGQGDRPDGCLFNPRCPKADDRCRTIVPPRQPPELGEALCHYPVGADPRRPEARPSGNEAMAVAGDAR
ncbi:ABC transporter ATP-binding protein [Consotaella aegiceratis]|uniref:ABC transporter ATP-binding protein n=1 Tax=Consotaella aegiceratis TaxID=3097961 RepID=UPI002F4078A8